MRSQQAGTELILAHGHWRAMFRLAVPVLAEESLTLMVTWTDWWLTGHFLIADGDAAKAAMGLMGYTMWLVPSLFAAVAIGATALVARRVGEGRRRRARLIANQSLLLGSALAILCTAAGWFAGTGYIQAMQLRGEAAKFAVQYLYILIPFIPLIMIEQVGAACLRGAGDTVTGMLAKAVVVVVNIAVSTVLVAGLLGFDAWGWTGIATGTAVGHAIGGTIILVALLRGRAGLKLSFRLWRPRTKIVKQLLRIGLPGGFDVLMLLTCQLVFVGLINSLGKGAAAAHGLAVQIEACAYLPAHAFQIAAATLTGQLLGARLPDRAVRSAVASVGTGMALISIAAVFMYVWGIDLAAFFTGNKADATTQQAAELLKIVAIALPSLALVMIGSGVLRGAGDTIWPFIITALGFVAIRIPLTFFLAFDSLHMPLVQLDLPGMGWGVSGAWCAMTIDLGVRSLMTLARLVHGGWKHVHV